MDAIGEEICVGLFAKRDGKKELYGVLKEYKDGDMLLDCEGHEMRISKEEAASCRLAFR